MASVVADDEALAGGDKRLVRRGDGLIQLFDPPFDKSSMDPGYIKGYIPGVRENGGQYTHGAIWTAMAFALMGDSDRAWELFAMLSPVHHGGTPGQIDTYRVEPYVVAADVYAVPPHTGRGGWTWYTGSAGWMYRAGLEWILGFRVEGAWLVLDPCIPLAWPGFEIDFCHRSACYKIEVENPDGVSRGVARMDLDGVAMSGAPCRVALVDDGQTHRVRVVLGLPAPLF